MPVPVPPCLPGGVFRGGGHASHCCTVTGGRARRSGRPSSAVAPPGGPRRRSGQSGHICGLPVPHRPDGLVAAARDLGDSGLCARTLKGIKRSHGCQAASALLKTQAASFGQMRQRTTTKCPHKYVSSGCAVRLSDLTALSPPLKCTRPHRGATTEAELLESPHSLPDRSRAAAPARQLDRPYCAPTL